MKILIVDPYAGRGGGGEFQLAFLSICEKHFGKASVSTLRLKHSEGHSRLAGYLGHFRQAWNARHITKIADLIVIQGHYNPSSWLLGMVALRNYKKFIVIPHGDFVPDPRQERLYRSSWLKRVSWNVVGRRLLREASRVVVGSELEAQQYAMRGIAVDRIVKIPNPISVERPLATERNSVSFALWLGRISREKGLDLLIESWRIMKSQESRVKLKLVGKIDDDAVFRSLQRLIQRYDLHDSIDFLDWADGAAKIRLLADARCVLLPSHFESFGRVVPEAIAAGTPVIASSATPWKSIESIGCKWLDRHPENWAAAITYFASGPEKRTLNRAACIEFLSEYSFEKVTFQWQALFQEIRHKKA